MPFTSPPNPQDFNQQVWSLVRQIPAGRVATYGQIALMLPPPMGIEFVKDKIDLKKYGWNPNEADQPKQGQLF